MGGIGFIENNKGIIVRDNTHCRAVLQWELTIALEQVMRRTYAWIVQKLEMDMPAAALIAGMQKLEQ
jgi:hypothetical protein